METFRVENWDQFKRLLILVEEWYNMTDVYDCPFPILAGETARQFCNPNQYAYYILYDTKEQRDAGYQNYSLDISGVYHNLWVDVTYMREGYRGMKNFTKHFLPVIHQIGEAANVNTVRFTNPMKPETWEKMTGRKIKTEQVMIITNEKYDKEIRYV